MFIYLNTVSEVIGSRFLAVTAVVVEISLSIITLIILSDFIIGVYRNDAKGKIVKWVGKVGERWDVVKGKDLGLGREMGVGNLK